MAYPDPYRNEPLYDTRPSTFNVSILFILGVIIGGISLLLVILPSIIFMVLWVLSLMGSLALLIFLIYDAFANKHFLSIPAGLGIVSFALFAAPAYRFLFCYSGKYENFRVDGIGVTHRLQENKTYIYAGLIAFGILLAVSIAMLIGKKLRAIPHTILSTVVCAIVVCSIIIPTNATINNRMPEMYSRIANAEEVKHYVTTKDTDLYWGVRISEDKGMSVNTETIYFPNTLFIPRVSVKTIPKGTEFSSSGNVVDDMLDLCIDESTVGYVRLKDTSLNEELAKNDVVSYYYVVTAEQIEIYGSVKVYKDDNMSYPQSARNKTDEIIGHCQKGDKLDIVEGVMAVLSLKDYMYIKTEDGTVGFVLKEAIEKTGVITRWDEEYANK